MFGIASQERTLAYSRMGPDEEIRQHVVFLAPLPTVADKGFPSKKQLRLRQFDQRHAQVIKGSVQGFKRRKCQRQLGVDNRIDGKRTYLRLGTQLTRCATSPAVQGVEG